MKNYLLSILSDFWRSVRLELIGRSADIVSFTLFVIQREVTSPNYLRRLHIPELGDFYGGIPIVGDFQC